MEILGLWFLFGVCAAVVASQRGGNGCVWLLIGFFLGPIGFALAFTQGVTCEYCGKKISTKASFCPYCRVATSETKPVGGVVLHEEFGNTKTCPYCAEQVKLEAIKCKHCGSMI